MYDSVSEDQRLMVEAELMTYEAVVLARAPQRRELDPPALGAAAAQTLIGAANAMIDGDGDACYLLQP